MIPLKTVIRMMVLATVFLHGCSGSLERMESWMGVSREAVIKSLGHPNAHLKTEFGDLLKFHRHKDTKGRVTCSDDFTFTDNTVTGYASNCGVWGGYLAPVFNQQ